MARAWSRATGPDRSGDDPGPVFVGESQFQEPFEVQSRNTELDPGMVLPGAAVSQAPVVVGDEPGYGSFDQGPVLPVVLLES